jgi:hypothetical protein
MRERKRSLTFFLMALFIIGSLPITNSVSAEDEVDNWPENDAWLHIELIAWSANETVEWDNNGGLPDPIFKICIEADGDNLDCINTPTWENQMTLNNSWNYSIDIPDHTNILNITIECEDNDALNDDECDMNSELDEWKLYAEYNWSVTPTLTVTGNGDGDGNETWKNAASTWKFTIDGFGDEDGDGISDDDDACPGFDDMDDFDNDGIPSGCDDDDDGDGTPDGDDLCANTPLGAIVDWGCPMDEDEDGVYDGLDDCPNSNGDAGVDANGCDLDTDNDGLPDWDDLCPNTPEGEEIDLDDYNYWGCSSSQIDRDEDGVTDNIDLCPSTYSWLTVDNDGCAAEQLDDDNDGVSNAIDACPNTPEDFNALNARGCSFEDLQDSDDDGIPDLDDTCPNTPLGAEVDFMGCPSDSDADGVFNGIDECPNTSQGSTVNSLGCSDADGDGIYDTQDECENTPLGATTDSKGCPMDSDYDGVYDGIDECPSSDNPAPSDMDKSSEVDSTGCFVDAAESGIDSKLASGLLAVMFLLAVVIFGVLKIRSPKQEQVFYAQSQSVGPVQQQSVLMPQVSLRERELENQSRQAQIEAQKLRQQLANQAQLTQQLQSEVAQKQISDAALAQKQHELAVARQEKEELEAKLAEAEKKTPIVQNITYNIQDSAISGDITNKIN